ncbi:unnamed protein product [Rhizoctonia solani]|uniref:O-methylsterigmatocystin oxidoreductase n=1 Tax=Rhizoctonia solani TaxID=456999 RepID=A0A8H3D3Q0_9AGAM|nr:unnamed protein product [Rhizoctonia solani]
MPSEYEYLGFMRLGEQLGRRHLQRLSDTQRSDCYIIDVSVSPCVDRTLPRVMTRDETVYKNADVFDPDRFLDPSTPLTPGFGWGRRRCPGTHFAEASLFIIIASVLTTFDIGVAQDENGKDIIPSRKMSSLLTPQNFIFKLTPRST